MKKSNHKKFAMFATKIDIDQGVLYDTVTADREKEVNAAPGISLATGVRTSEIGGRHVGGASGRDTSPWEVQSMKFKEKATALHGKRIDTTVLVNKNRHDETKGYRKTDGEGDRLSKELNYDPLADAMGKYTDDIGKKQAGKGMKQEAEINKDVLNATPLSVYDFRYHVDKDRRTGVKLRIGTSLS